MNGLLLLAGLALIIAAVFLSCGLAAGLAACGLGLLMLVYIREVNRARVGGNRR